MDAVKEKEIYGDVDQLFVEADGLMIASAQQQAGTNAASNDLEIESWEGAAEMIIFMLDKSVLFKDSPMEGTEREYFLKSLTAVLDRYLPGGFSNFDNWHPVIQLAGVSGWLAFNRKKQLIAWAGRRNKDQSGVVENGESGRADDAGNGSESKREVSGLDPAD